MKIQILSDLHIEFEDFEPQATDAEVIVLAGDIGVGMQGLLWAQNRFARRTVVYVPGNHEFYHHDIAVIDELKALAPGHIHVLDDDRVIIGGVRFLGSILWTDFALMGDADKSFAIQHAQQCMTDYSVIRNHGRRFTPEDAMGLHKASREWLAASLAQPFDGKTVVITHHAPSSRSVHPRYAGDLLSAAFASNLEPMMGGRYAALWIHGHVHNSFDYEVDGTRVVCNPRGYAPHALNGAFRPDTVVEV